MIVQGGEDVIVDPDVFCSDEIAVTASLGSRIKKGSKIVLIGDPAKTGRGNIWVALRNSTLDGTLVVSTPNLPPIRENSPVCIEIENSEVRGNLLVKLRGFFSVKASVSIERSSVFGNLIITASSFWKPPKNLCPEEVAPPTFRIDDFKVLGTLGISSIFPGNFGVLLMNNLESRGTNLMKVRGEDFIWGDSLVVSGAGSRNPSPGRRTRLVLTDKGVVSVQDIRRMMLEKYPQVDLKQMILAENLSTGFYEYINANIADVVNMNIDQAQEYIGNRVHQAIQGSYNNVSRVEVVTRLGDGRIEITVPNLQTL